VRDATEATARAVAGANEAAQANYGISPFTMNSVPASFDGRRWIWRTRVACGKSDLEAEVWLSLGGTVEKLDVQLLSYEAVR